MTDNKPHLGENMEQDIFDLNDVDLDQIADSQDSNEGIIEAIPTDDPYWQIPSSELAIFLQLASLFSWRSGRDLTSKSVSLTTSTDKAFLECRATDFDTYLLYKIPLTGQKPIPQCLIFPTSTLVKLVKLCPKHLVIKQGQGSPSSLILGQWVEIEPIILDPSLYINTDPIQPKGQFEVPKLLSSLIPIASSAVVPKDRNLQFFTEALQCTYLWSTIQVESPTPVSFILSARESNLLKALSSDTIQLGITESDLPRLSLSTERSTLLLIHRKPENPITQFNFPEFYIEIDPSILHSLVQLSETLPSSSGLLQFQYTETDGMIITYCSKLSNTPYTVSCNTHGKPTALDPSMLQTKILKQLLKPLGNKPIKLSWDSTTLFVQSEEAKLSIQFES